MMNDSSVYISEERLIMKVKEYPALYDHLHPSYSDRENKEALWNEIGAAMKASGPECKTKWQILRGSFRRTHKLMTSTKAGKKGKRRRIWKWYNVMTFLIPHLEDLNVKNISKIEECDMMMSQSDETNHSMLEMEVRNGRREREVEEESGMASPSPSPSEYSMVEGNTIFIPEQAIKQEVTYPEFVRGSYRLPNTSERKRKQGDGRGSGEWRPDGLKKFFESMYEAVKTFPPGFQIQAKRAVFEAVMDLETQLENLNTHQMSP